jgi:hypothetical protein
MTRIVVASVALVACTTTSAMGRWVRDVSVEGNRLAIVDCDVQLHVTTGYRGGTSSALSADACAPELHDIPPIDEAARNAPAGCRDAVARWQAATLEWALTKPALSERRTMWVALPDACRAYLEELP